MKIAKLLLVLFVLSITSCVSTPRGYDYKAHSKKGKSVKYRGDLTKFKCGR